MDLNIEIREQKKSKEIRSNQKINQNTTNIEVSRDHFVPNGVRGEGNWTLKAILKTDIDENQHLILCKETNFEEETLKEHSFENVYYFLDMM